MNVLNLKDILSIKIKYRYDSYSDQWNRILVSKIFLITSVVVGIDYFHDSVSCLIPATAEIDMSFVQSTCWITGFYIYPDIKAEAKHLGYHGIPRDLSLNGMDNNEKLCATITKYGELDPNCIPFKKEYYLQYQWYPFFLGTVSIIYYLPYLVFFISSKDIRDLQSYLLRGEVCDKLLVKSYFNYLSHSKNMMRVRLLATLLVKLLYLLVNFLSFLFLDKTLNGKFTKYGLQWIEWSKLNSTMAHDLHMRGFPKPGNNILPPMGLCDVHDSSRDVRNTRINAHKFICEISPHILYQYCLILLWFLLTFSILISFIGLVLELIAFISIIFCYIRRRNTIALYNRLTIRECQYLEEIRKTDTAVYKKVLHKLAIERCPGECLSLNNTMMETMNRQI